MVLVIFNIYRAKGLSLTVNSRPHTWNFAFHFLLGDVASMKVFMSSAHMFLPLLFCTGGCKFIFSTQTASIRSTTEPSNSWVTNHKSFYKRDVIKAALIPISSSTLFELVSLCKKRNKIPRQLEPLHIIYLPSKNYRINFVNMLHYFMI